MKPYKSIFMIKRVVKLNILPEHAEEFKSLFEEIKQEIRGFEGCEHLELWRDVNNPDLFFTYSFWKDPSDLEKYRKSAFFGQIWPRTKKMFGAKAEAWSIEVIDSLKA